MTNKIEEIRGRHSDIAIHVRQVSKLPHDIAMLLDAYDALHANYETTKAAMADLRDGIDKLRAVLTVEAIETAEVAVLIRRQYWEEGGPIDGKVDEKQVKRFRKTEDDLREARRLLHD
jgi:hypothetical protein